jgi:hypothetical protein
VTQAWYPCGNEGAIGQRVVVHRRLAVQGDGRIQPKVFDDALRRTFIGW